jgi:hypothetical protein
MANIELDGANKKIKVDSGDLTLDVPGDIILDADGADLVFADGGTNILKITNSSSDVVLQPQVDAKDIIFKQYDGTTVATVEDNGTFNIPTDKLAINGTAVTSTAAELNILDGVTATATELNLIDGVTATTAELNILDGVTSTAAELNIVDGNTSATSTTIADADRVVLNDNGTMVQAAVTDLKTYIGGFDVSSITGATALAAQPAADDEIVLSDAGTLKRLDIKHIQNTPAFHAYLGSNQTVANNTVTRINFNTELFDSDGCYDNSTNYRFTPGVAGKYFLYYQMKNNNQTDYIYSRIRKNNSDIQIETHYTGADVDDFARGFTIVDSDADDYFDIHLQQTKGSDQTVSSGAQNTFFGGFRIAGV